MNERQLFESALEIADPQARQAFLDGACQGDADLRAKVDALLKSHATAGSFLDIPAAEQMGPRADNITTNTIVGATADGQEDSDDSQADLSFLQPSSKPGSIGLLGHYEVLSVLGQGAFGIVFKAFDEKLHRHVAIKAMNPQLAATSPPRKRFLREARSVAAIKHENIVQVYSVEEQPLPYLVMEYIDGLTLQQKLDGAGPLEVPEILHLGRQMAAGLAAAHDKGLIHRDIKPGNILLESGAEQKVKITDFGLARAADDATMTRTGTIAGTPMYMAPEQAMGQDLDHRADLFSLGSVLYQMSCGRAPFRGANAIAVLKRVVDETPRPIRQILPEVPDWLCAIIEKLHAKNPDERYQSAREVADLLARCQSELQLTGKVTCVAVPSNAVRESSNQPTSVVPTPVVVPPQVERSSAAPTSRQPLKFAAVAVVLLMAGLALTELSEITSFFRKPASVHQPVVSGDTQPQTQVLTTQTTSNNGWHGWPADAPKPAIAPFDAEQAKRHQEEWAAYLKVPVEYTNSIGMKFRLIPPGEFTMGMTKEEAEAVAAQSPSDEHWKTMALSSAPLHKVRLTQAYYLGTYEVTQDQYEKVVGANPSYFSASGEGKELVKDEDSRQHPVEMVSYIDAAEFCIKLSKQEQLKPVYFSANNVIALLPGDGYRLPTEAEWEYACRAGTNTAWFHGEQESTLGTVAWFGGNSGGRTHAVGQLKANPFGLYDLHGNVWEWCQDWYDVQAYTKRGADITEDPQGPDAGPARVLRGGSWNYDSSGCRSAFRYALDVGYRVQSDGFRVLVGVDAVRQALKVTGPAMPQSVASNSKSAPSGWHGWPADAPKPAIAPFNADQAKRHQEEWAAYLKVPVEYTNSIGMKFRLIPPGEFMMGSTAEEIEAAMKEVGSNDTEHWQDCIRSEAPLHKVILTQPSYVAVNEVTQAKYEKVMGTNPSWFAPMGNGKDAIAGRDTANHPVEMVSWNDAAEFCATLSETEQFKPYYFRAGDATTLLAGTGYRLPSEAEWQFACGAGTNTNDWIGFKEKESLRVGWFLENGDSRTHAVGELFSNAFGLNDVHGNVWEWVQDGWSPTFYTQFQEKPAIAPVSPFSARSPRLTWGGAYNMPASHCRASGRFAADPTGRNSHLGFRVSLPVDAVQQALKVTGPAMPKSVATIPSAPTDDTAKLPPKFTNKLGMEFVKVPKGTGWLGGGGGKQGEQKVEFADDFYLGKYEVTQAEWEKVTGLNPSHFSRNGAGKEAVKEISDADLKRFPIEMVSWDDCQLFLERLNQQTKETGWVYRLPKEAEWEYACRGGPVDKLDSAFDFYFAKPTNTLLPEQANFEHGKGLGRTCKVGLYSANWLGLYDMHGNVWEWCEESPPSPSDYKGDLRPVLRGGCWRNDSEGCRAATRFASQPLHSDHYLIGLRLARVRVGAAVPTTATPPTPTAPSPNGCCRCRLKRETCRSWWVSSRSRSSVLRICQRGPFMSEALTQVCLETPSPTLTWSGWAN